MISGNGLEITTKNGTIVKVVDGNILLTTPDNQVVELTDGGNVTISSPTDIDLQVTGGPSIQLTPTAVLMRGLPATDPHVPGALWADSTASFAVKVSQG